MPLPPLTPPQAIAASEFILGGQKSGKSRRAEWLARDWLGTSPQHHAVLLATGQPWDDELRERCGRDFNWTAIALRYLALYRRLSGRP